MQINKVLGLVLICALASCESGKNRCKVKNPACITEDNAAINPVESQAFIADAGDIVFFEFDSSSLTNEAQATLQRQSEWLKARCVNAITIEGHCDERGTQEYNRGLGERRANAVAEYLYSLGIDKDVINIVSYGKDRPVKLLEDCGNNNEQFWKQNRVARTILIKVKEGA